jgi:sulfate/thiosulfate transport system ATP-binding protein
MSIVIHQVSKCFGTFQALDRIDLAIPEGKLVALLGPSGSGKSTLLRSIAGLENPDTGSIIVNGQDTTRIDPRKRNIGFVFQHYALFKHLTVRQNIAFGLEIRKQKPPFIKKRVEELLDLIQLQGLGDRYPSQLSGGQRQRVALARALAIQPSVLLLDEPFGALDAKVRKELRAWLRRLHEEVHVTSVFVTHDQEEAMEVADTIVVMNQGKIEQVGSPAEIYDRPATPFVMQFIGEVNIVHGLTGFSHASSDSRVFIRPHDLEILTRKEATGDRATVKRVIHLGWEIQVELLLDDGAIVMAYLSREEFARLQLEPDRVVCIKPKKATVWSDFDNNHQRVEEFLDYSI